MKKLILLLVMAFSLFAIQPSFLMPDEAFKPSAKLNANMQIEAKVWIAKEIYLYENFLKFKINNIKNIDIKEVIKPKSVEHHGDMVYLKTPEFIIDLKKLSNITNIEEIELEIAYQGCSEQGLCYEPYTKVFKLSIDSSKLSLSNELKILKTVSKIVEKEELSQTDKIADTIKSGSLIVILLTFLGFGLLLALTPCVFPMIPIISGVIISQGEGLTTKKAFFLSVVYVLAMAVAYTIAGVLAGLFGSNLQATLQAPWVIYSFSAVFVALAMSMFGFYELKLPDSLVAKVSSSSSKSGFVGVAIMGFLSALIVGPCVAAPLAGALVYIGQTGDAVLGGMALFSMSIGMGLPLIAVGVSAGKFMPRPGAWMTMVSAIFGIMMLGVAIWMLERIVSYDIIILLYAMLGISSAVYFGAFQSSLHVFQRSVAIIIFIYSTSLFIGFLAGSTSMIKPLSFLSSASVVSSSTKHLNFIKVTSLDELDLVLAKNKGKKIMLDFSAEWCTACKELEEVTFSNKDVQAKLSDYVLINADVTQNSDTQKAMSKKYGVFGPPVLIFFDKELKVIKSKTIVGFIEPNNFLKHLAK
jgi:thiol:disulfide interchange protein DsbD